MKRFASLFLLLSGTVAFAQSAPPAPAAPESASAADSSKLSPNSSHNSLIISGEFDHISSTQNGGSGSLDWVGSNNRGRTYTAGVAFFAIGNSQWRFAKVGAAFRPQERITIQGQTSLGAGHIAAAGFPYQILEGGLAYKTSRRLYLKFDDEYLHIGETRGNLLKPGALFVPLRRLTADITYAHSAGGNLDSTYVSGRLDFQLRPVRILAGFAVGNTTPEIFNVGVGQPPRKENLQEGFCGFGVPLSRSELTVVSDFLNLGATRKRMITFSWKFVLGKQ